jgi:hypothetical protein
MTKEITKASHYTYDMIGTMLWRRHFAMMMYKFPSVIEEMALYNSRSMMKWFATIPSEKFNDEDFTWKIQGRMV